MAPLPIRVSADSVASRLVVGSIKFILGTVEHDPLHVTAGVFQGTYDTNWGGSFVNKRRGILLGHNHTTSCSLSLLF